MNGTIYRKQPLPFAGILHQLYRELGSWTLVAAAYNGGITHVRNKMEQQGQSNYYRLTAAPRNEPLPVPDSGVQRVAQ